MRAKTASAGNHKTPQVNCSQLQPSLSPASACRLMLSPVPPPPQAAFFPDFDPCSAPRANLCSPSQPGTATRSSREARGSPPQRGGCPRSSHLCSHRGLGSPGDAARPGADLGDLQTALERKRCMQRGRAGNLPATGGGELPGGGLFAWQTRHRNSRGEGRANAHLLRRWLCGTAGATPRFVCCSFLMEKS